MDLQVSEDDSRVFELEEQLVEARAGLEEQEDAIDKMKAKLKSIEEEKLELLNAVQDLVKFQPCFWRKCFWLLFCLFVCCCFRKTFSVWGFHLTIYDLNWN